LQADVLVVGGGFGGLWAALRASECGSSVLLVDRSFAGKSGHSHFASGAMMVCLPGDDLDEYVREVVQGNEWLVDQDMVAGVFAGSYERLRELERFGIGYRKEKGEYVWTKARGTASVKNLWPEHGSAADIVTTLRKVALRRGVRILDHVFVSDLLTSRDGGVVGALGIGRAGIGYVLGARATVLATNSGGFRGHHLASDLQGTGPFLAYETGARLKNPEFHYVNIRPAKHEIEGSGILPALGARWVNGRGEHYMARYEPELQDRAPAHRIVLAAAKEALAGNGPISIDVRGMTEENRERFKVLMVSHGWQPILHEKLKREEGYDFLRDNIEWKPAYESNKVGIDADLEGKSSVAGLYGAGMARVLGINPFTGWSIASSIWSGYAAGEGAARHAKETSGGSVDDDRLEALHARFFSPRGKKGGFDADRVTLQLQKILFPVHVLISMCAKSLQAALDEVGALRAEVSGSFAAREVRELVKARETETMLLAAEMTLKASLMREETRPNLFYREDYPEPDDDRWLKWIVVERGAEGDMLFSAEHVPFPRYRFRPPDRRRLRSA
jgi:succinate dehydrogenase/fumarate reductase flavoprotein subunit